MSIFHVMLRPQFHTDMYIVLVAPILSYVVLHRLQQRLQSRRPCDPSGGGVYNRRLPGVEDELSVWSCQFLRSDTR